MEVFCTPPENKRKTFREEREAGRGQIAVGKMVREQEERERERARAKEWVEVKEEE